MRRLFLAVALAAFSSGDVRAASCYGQTSAPLVAFNFETVTVSTSSIGLTATTFNPTNCVQNDTCAVQATLTFAVDESRWRADGGAPTSTVGHLAASGGTMTVCQADLPAFRAIRSSGSAASVLLSVTYFRVR